MPAYKTGRLEVHSADMSKPNAYDGIFEGPVCVFHPAEIFMSFSSGRDYKKAQIEFGQSRPKLFDLNLKAMQSNQHIVSSINKSSTVKRLVYTSSVAAMSPGQWEGEYVIDESRQPSADFFGAHSYAVTKRSTEHFFAYHACLSGGRWSVLIANPGDIIGPILSRHQASETWQGKIASVLRGTAVQQEPNGRPWWTVDVRDIALAQILLAEQCRNSMSGRRFLLASGDVCPPETLGPRINELFPEFAPLPSIVVKPKKAKKLARSDPLWQRVSVDNGNVRRSVGLHFRSWDDSLAATVRSLISVGGVEPLLR